MEPFGLFQLLQSFLAAAPAQAQTSPQKSEEKIEENPPQETPKKEKVNYSQQAIMGFLSEHERRSCRIKK